MMDFALKVVAIIFGWATKHKIEKFEALGNPELVPNETMEAVAALEAPTAEDIRALDIQLWDNTTALVRERHERKLAERSNRYVHRTSNRALFLPAPLATITSRGEEARAHWSFLFDLVSAGLVEHYMANRDMTTDEPTSFLINNGLPLNEEGRQFQPSAEEWAIFRKENHRVSKARLLWNWKAVAPVVVPCLPKAIDFTAYNHRLRAPLLPGGYYNNAVIRAVPLLDATHRVGEAPEFITSGSDGSGVYDPDHPMMAEMVAKYGKVIFQLTCMNHETGVFVKGLVRPLEGACIAYGMTSTDEEGNWVYGATGVFVDHLQIKGHLKSLHKEAKETYVDEVAESMGVEHDHYIDYEVDIGFMDARRGHKTLSAGFEQLENVDQRIMGYCFPVDKQLMKRIRPYTRWEVRTSTGTEWLEVIAGMTRGDKAWILTWGKPSTTHGETAHLVAFGTPVRGTSQSIANCLAKNLLGDSLEELGEGGVEAQIERAAKEDTQIRLLLEFAKAASAVAPPGTTLPNIKGLKMVRNAVEDRLQGALWRACTGAGIVGKQGTIIMDAAVAPGTMVCRAAKPGQPAAVWRFPTVLSCGLLVLVGAQPLRSHLVDEEVIENAVFMNPLDVRKIQGDDDGDMVGISTDPRVVGLFACRHDNRFYAIEPEGQKLDFNTESPEGEKYGEHDPMGAVGLFTIFRTKLMAVGDTAGALAMSVLIQEAIDSGKKKVKFSDFRSAANPQAWKKVGDCYKLHYEGSNNFHPEEDIDEASLIMEVTPWVNNRLTNHGCIVNKDTKQNPISWYYQYKQDEEKDKLVRLDKRIGIKQWAPTKMKSKGFEGGNLLHCLHDWGLDWWNKHEKEFNIPEQEQAGLADFLPKVLNASGVQVQNRLLDQEVYDQLATRLGITLFGKEMSKAMSTQASPEIKNIEVDRALAGLHSQLRSATLQDLVDVWVHSMTPRWRLRNSIKDSWEYTVDEKRVKATKSKKGCGPWAVNKPQTGFRVITFPGSPVLAFLGITVPEHCKFLEAQAKTAPTRLEAITNICLATKQPFDLLTKIVFGDAEHAKEIKDGNGNPVFLHECEHCRDQLQTKLVRAVRDLKRTTLTESACALMTRVRSYPRVFKYGHSKEADAPEIVVDSDEQYEYL